MRKTPLSAPAFGLRREIDRLFEDTFGTGDGTSTWIPAVDIRETSNEVRLDVEVPGMHPEDVEVTAENGVLTVRGEKRSERKEGEEQSRYHLVERAYGSFFRSFQLPQGIDESKIQATCDNGILSIHIPKAALPQPRKIEVGRNQRARQGAMGSGEKHRPEPGNGSEAERGAPAGWEARTTAKAGSSTDR